MDALRAQMKKTAAQNTQLRAKVTRMKTEEEINPHGNLEETVAAQAKKIQQLQFLHQQLIDQLRQLQDVIRSLEKVGSVR